MNVLAKLRRLCNYYCVASTAGSNGYSSAIVHNKRIISGILEAYIA
jgi:hypothetical protein